VFGRYHARTIEALSDCANCQARLEDYDASLRVYDIAKERACALHGSNSRPVALILSQIARVWEAQGEAARAEESCEEALSIMREKHPEDVDTIDMLTQLAELKWHQTRYSEAFDSYKQALRLEQHVRGKLHVSTGQTLRCLALLAHDFLDQKDKAVRYLRAARVAFSSTLGEDHEYTKEVDKLFLQWDAKMETASVTESWFSRSTY